MFAGRGSAEANSADSQVSRSGLPPSFLMVKYPEATLAPTRDQGCSIVIAPTLKSLARAAKLEETEPCNDREHHNCSAKPI